MAAEGDNPQRANKGRWRKGMSGNPDGRPSGRRNQSAAFLESLLSGQGEALIQKGIELSLQGDTRALRICWDRLLPPRKERSIELTLPAITDAKSVATALAAVVNAVAEGRVTPGEGECLARVLETQMRIVEFEALAQRVSELEKVHLLTPPTPEPSDASTLSWIAHNYSIAPPDSRMTPEEPREYGTGSAMEAEGQPLPSPGTSPTTSRPTKETQ
jgi:hypothetical protein